MTDSDKTLIPTDNLDLENLPAPIKAAAKNTDNLENLSAPTGVTSVNTKDFETPTTFNKLISGNIDDAQKESDNSETQIDKFNSNSHANLCFARGILYLIVTICRFIPIQFDDSTALIIFIVTLSILIVVTGIITIRGHKDSKNLKIVGRIYYVFYFLCFLLLMKSYSSLDRPFTKTPFKEMQYILIFPWVVDCFCGILYKVYVVKNIIKYIYQY